MPSPSEASSEVAPPAASAAASPVSAALVAGNHAAPRPSADLRDDTDSSSDDEYADDGFAAAHAAFLARRIADERSAQSSGGAQPAGMSPFDESVINHEWDELVRSMKAIVPTVAHFVGSSMGPLVFAAICTWLGFSFHKVVLDRVG